MGALFCLFGGFVFVFVIVIGFGAGLAVVAFEKAFKDFNNLPM